MGSWPALLLSPLITLGNLTLTYALVTPSCNHQHTTWLHAATLLSALLSLVLTVLAGLEWRRLRLSPGSAYAAADGVEGVTARRQFIALVSLWCGSFFTVTILAQWIAQWLLSPCLQ